MAEFDSPLGKKKIKSGTPMREFSVPDESENPFNVEQALKNPNMRQININEIEDFANRINQSYSEPVEPPAEQVVYSKNPYARGAIPYPNAPVPQRQAAPGPSDFEAEVQAAREYKRTGIQRLDAGAKHRLEMLLGMLRQERTVKIGEVEFVLQTLSGVDQQNTIRESSQYDGSTDVAFEMRDRGLTRAIKSIAGASLDKFVGSTDFEVKLEVVKSLGDLVLNKLNAELNILNKEVKDKLNVDTKQGVEEVMSDIKK